VVVLRREVHRAVFPDPDKLSVLLRERLLRGLSGAPGRSWLDAHLRPIRQVNARRELDGIILDNRGDAHGRNVPRPLSDAKPALRSLAELFSFGDLGRISVVNGCPERFR
jgi:hypothetical protein